MTPRVTAELTSRTRLWDSLPASTASGDTRTHGTWSGRSRPFARAASAASEPRGNAAPGYGGPRELVLQPRAGAVVDGLADNPREPGDGICRFRLARKEPRLLQTSTGWIDSILEPRLEGQVPTATNIYSVTTMRSALRRRVGRAFQKSNPFPSQSSTTSRTTCTVNGLASSRSNLHGRVEESLKQAALWDEVKDRLKEVVRSRCRAGGAALHRRGPWRCGPRCSFMGQSHRGPYRDAAHRGTNNYQLKKDYTIVIVPHTTCSRRHACPTSAAFFWLGKLVEFEIGPTSSSRRAPTH